MKYKITLKPCYNTENYFSDSFLPFHIMQESLNLGVSCGFFNIQDIILAIKIYNVKPFDIGFL